MNLPQSTVFNRFVPKEKFYTKTSVSNKLRQQFTDEVGKIKWTNKIAPDTLNITSKDYAELQVFEIKLKRSELSLAVLKHIDTFIPYPILFILKRPNAIRAVISFKQPVAKNESKMKIERYYETKWQQELQLELKGRSVDEIYKNYIFQIEPRLNDNSHTDIKSAIETNKTYEKTQNQIDSINKKIASEPSIAKKQALARQRHQLEQDLNGDQ